MESDTAFTAAMFAIPTSPLSSPPPHTPSSPITTTSINDTHDSDDCETIDNSLDEDTNSGPRVRLSQQEKLQIVLATLRSIQWSFSHFLKVWAGAVRTGQGADILLERTRHRTCKQRQELLYHITDEIRTFHGLSQAQAFKSVIIQEISTLIGKEHFDVFRHTVNPDDIDFSSANRVIAIHAPIWSDLLYSVLTNERAHRPSYGAGDQGDVISSRLYMITSLVCHSRAKLRSNALQSLLSVYLLGSGVKRRVIELLARLGICLGYHQGNRLMKRIAVEGEVRSFRLLSNSP